MMTMSQLDIFRDSPGKAQCPGAAAVTQRVAAAQIAPATGTLRRKVLFYLFTCGTAGATDEQMQVGLDLNPSTQRPRRIELVEAGLVKDSGRTDKTRSGRSAVVWVVTDEGSAAL